MRTCQELIEKAKSYCYIFKKQCWFIYLIFTYGKFPYLTLKTMFNKDTGLAVANNHEVLVNIFVYIEI